MNKKNLAGEGWPLYLGGMLISLKDIKKKFNQENVLNGISFDVEEGDLVALIGPSGCGKSTLLRCLNGLECLDSGCVQINGTTLMGPSDIGESEFQLRAQGLRQIVGMVFQNFNLFPHLSVLENLMKAPMVVKGLDDAQAEQIARSLLDKVGLKEFGQKYPNELSGGQQQRAAIARALAMNPKVLLYDEPTSALDPALVDEVLRVMKQLDIDGMTQIIVTHEMRFARQVADKIIYLEEGRIVEMGPPDEIFTHPKDDRTRQFLKHYL